LLELIGFAGVELKLLLLILLVTVVGLEPIGNSEEFEEVVTVDVRISGK